MGVIGRVTVGGDAMVPVTVHSGDGDELTIESLIDTGFNGGIALPSHHIEALALSQRGRERMRLASGGFQFAGTYRAVVEMGEKRYSVRVIEAGEPLIGMALLGGNDLHVQCVEGDTLPSRRILQRSNRDPSP